MIHQEKVAQRKRRPMRAYIGSDDEKRASALVTMTYITMSICNAYMEETKEILESYGIYKFELKHECETAIRMFDRYHAAIFKYFKNDPMANRQIIEVYEGIKRALDEEILANVEKYNRAHWDDKLEQSKAAGRSSE